MIIEKLRLYAKTLNISTGKQVRTKRTPTASTIDNPYGTAYNPYSSATSTSQVTVNPTPVSAPNPAPTSNPSSKPNPRPKPKPKPSSKQDQGKGKDKGEKGKQGTGKGKNNKNNSVAEEVPISEETQEILNRRKRWEDDGPYINRSAKGNVQTTYEMPEVSPEFYNTSYLKEPSQLPQKLNIPRPDYKLAPNKRSQIPTAISNFIKARDYGKAKIAATSSVPNQPKGGIAGWIDNKLGKWKDRFTSRYSIKYDLNTRTFSLIENG